MRYYLTGRVLPERCDVFILRIQQEVPDIGTVIFSCESSQISVIIENTIRDPETVYLFAKHFATIIISSFGFSKGCNYSVEMINVHDEQMNSSVHGVQITNLEDEDSSLTFINIMYLSFKDFYLRFAIFDYTKSINSEIECPFLCYRAIETIKSRFQKDNLESNGWDLMHQELGTNGDEIKVKIKPYADVIRHGSYSDLEPTNFEQRLEILLLTKRIIKLYIDYLVKENEKKTT